MSKSFHWMTDPTPDWFSKDYSYRMNPDTKEIELPTQSGNVIVSPGELITEAKGGFFVIGAIKPNRATRRHNAKTEERLVVQSITIEFEGGRSVNLDPSKVMIVDKDTKAQLFDYVIEGV